VACLRDCTKTRFMMPLPVEDIEMQALSLPPEDRARLLERLIASFEPKSPSQAAWMQLAQRRREDVRSGLSSMVPGDEALARVRARLA
jgi:putative addiction module component (TIGR02574 family)